MSNKYTNDFIAQAFDTVAGREELAESMIMPIIPPSARARILARREAIEKGCIEVKQERE